MSVGTGLRRLSIVGSAVWLAVTALFFSIGGYFDWEGFIVLGIAPVLLLVGAPWGIWWVLTGFRLR